MPDLFPTENDSDVGIERFKERYNADLANNLGNLVSRVAKLAEELDFGVFENVSIDGEVVKLIDNFRFDEALNWVFSEYVDKTNNLLNQETPWKLDKNDPKRKEILLNAVFNLRNAALNLRPIMPEISKRILEVFDGEIKPLEKPLFPRI